MANITIAIDGYSGCGKSTTAQELARKLGYTYIDTGAMYRAVTLYFIRNNIAWDNKMQLEQTLQMISIDFHRDPKSKKNTVQLNGEPVEEFIRDSAVSSRVSEVSALPAVRAKLVKIQRAMGKNGGVVMDGRDIGTVVFPDAELKIFMTADISIRAKRRKVELQERGREISLEEVTHNLMMRDKIDTTRKESPLIKAPDAIEIDTSRLTFEMQLQLVYDLAMDKITEIQPN